MTQEQWEAVQEVVVAAWDLPEEVRGPFLLEKCGHDPVMLSEARALVEARRRANEWSAPQRAAAQSTARRYGSYEIERMIGRGGMGAVYLARRADGGFDQKAAIKIVGLPFEIESLRQRFKQERQILAALNHPNITRLIDGGVSDDGELYLAMEYVDGVPLDEFVKAHHLSESEKLLLFCQVAGAVAYAHKNMVIHRDLKPSNILVDASGVPKLLDFGTAKLLESKDTGQLTVTGGGLLTFLYASPEQLHGQPATTLSDVYSLGLILYEMLTGRSAFDGSLEARMASLEELKLPVPVASDLGLIVRKALESAPDRRYQSVRELSADVERYLNGHPVLARPGTLGYRASKFVRRNKIAVTAAALVLIVAASGAAMTLWQARRAQNRFDELRGFARFVLTDLHAGLQPLPGSTSLQRLSVERSLGHLDRLAAEAGEDDSLRLEAADGYRRLGDVMGNPYRPNLGDRKQAESLYRKGLDLARAMRTSDGSRRVIAELEIQLAGAAGFGGAKDAGLSQIQRAAAELKSLSDANPNDAGLRLAAAQAWEVLGTRLASGGGLVEGARAHEAEAAYAQSVALAEQALPSKQEAAILQLAQCSLKLGFLKGSTEPAVALGHYRNAATLLDRLPKQAALPARRLRVQVLSYMGWAEGQGGQYAAAVAHLTEGAQMIEWQSALDPDNTNLLYALAGAYRDIGIVETYRRNSAEAVAQFLKAANLHQRLSQLDPANKVYQYLRGELLIRAGNGLVVMGRPVDAVAGTREGLGTLRALASAPKPSLSHLFGACRWLTETEVVALRDGPAAATFCRNAMEASGGTDPDAFSGLAQALEISGDSAGAVRELEKAIALLPPAQPGQPISQQRKDLEAKLRKMKKLRS